MITPARDLTAKQLLFKGQINTEKNKTVWTSDDNEEILTSRSWVSLYLIIKLFNKTYNRKPIVFVPDYYCEDTLNNIDSYCSITFYKIFENLMPDFKYCKEIAKESKPDIFVFVHYFGKCLDASQATTFCRNNESILIEDAVHCFYPYNKIGHYGDFTLFSPWKTYGLMDGAILQINSRGVSGFDLNLVKKRLSDLNDQLPKLSKSIEEKWTSKHLLKKIIPNGMIKIAYQNRGINETEGKMKKDTPYQITVKDRIILENITIEEIDELGERKKENYLVASELIKRKYGVLPLFELDEGIPYALVVKTENRDKKQRIVKDISTIGPIANEWPDLPETSRLPQESLSQNIKDKLILISIHGGIQFKQLIKALAPDDEENSCIKKYELKEINRDEYQKVCEGNIPVPILQSIAYTDAKENIQGWKKQYWALRSIADDSVVAAFITLNKYYFVYRINHGPIVFNNTSDKLCMLQTIKTKFGSKGKALFFAPNLERNGSNLIALTKLNFKYLKKYFSTGFIDLSSDEEDLRKGLNSKWRNCLKNAEKRNMHVEEATDKEDFLSLLSLHSQDKEDRTYKDSGDELTNYLFDHECLHVIKALNDKNEVISFLMLAVHGNTGTYYIGWSNNEGYRSNASRLLLWRAIILAKKIGLKWFDVGGVDFINTKSIADFKMGTGCKYFEYVGEFLSF